MGTTRLVRRFYAYRATTSVGFYLPVGVVYLTEVRDFGLDAVGFVMAAYLVAMLTAEIPTGYLGDRVGRRASLAVGNGMMAASLVAWTSLHTPLEYALLNVFWATGTTFRSGTADAYLYELLAVRGEADEFARFSGRADTALLVVSAGSAVATGALVTVDWSLPFLANAALAAAGLPVLATLPAVGPNADVPGDASAGGSDENGPGNGAFTVGDAVRTLRIQATRPAVRWFVGYAALFYGLYQLAFAFEQPAARALGVPTAGLGLLYAGFKLVSAGGAAAAGRLQDRLGTRGVFVWYAPVVGVAYAAVAVVPVTLVPVFFLTHGLEAVARPIRNQYLNDRLADVGRATALSGASMVLSLVAAGADLLGGVVAEATGPVQFLAGAGVAAAAAGGLLWLTVSPVRPLAGTGSGDGDAPTPTD